MPNRPQRSTRLAVLTLTLLIVGAASACSSESEGSDPTSTIASAPGSSAPKGDEAPKPPTGTGTSIDPVPRTGTSLAGGTEDPPTGDESADDYTDALIASFTAKPDDLFTLENVECIAPKWVRAIGVRAFQAAGVTPADIAAGDAGIQDVSVDREAAEGIVEVIPDCGVDLVVVFVDDLPSEVKDDPTAVACIRETVSEEQIKEALIADVMGAAGDDPEELAAACIP